MKKSRKPEQFIKTPGYPGGREALSKFIRHEMRYPKEALQNKIEGTVVVSYTFGEDGKVIQTKVEHGIGYGCDEEAQRIVKKLQYPKVNNKGVRVTFRSKVKIQFRLKDVIQKQGLQYSYTASQSSPRQAPAKKKPAVYSYTVNFGK